MQITIEMTWKCLVLLQQQLEKRRAPRAGAGAGAGARVLHLTKIYWPPGWQLQTGSWDADERHARDNVNYVAIRRETCRSPRCRVLGLTPWAMQRCTPHHAKPKKKRIRMYLPRLHCQMQFKCEHSSKNFETWTRRKYFFYSIVFYIYNTFLLYLQSFSLLLWMIVYLVIVNYVLRSIRIDSTMMDSKLSGVEYLKSIEDFTANN